jgi:hypothetical protein
MADTNNIITLPSVNKLNFDGEVDAATSKASTMKLTQATPHQKAPHAVNKDTDYVLNFHSKQLYNKAVLTTEKKPLYMNNGLQAINDHHRRDVTAHSEHNSYQVKA